MSKKILSVDDSSITRKLILYVLNSLGFQALQAEDGVTALEVLRSEAVDAILLDINMPRMNGLELLQKIKAEPAFTHIPVVMLTTEGQDEDKERAFALGASKYIIKPFSPAQLMSVLDEILQRNEEPFATGALQSAGARRKNPEEN